MVILQKLLKLLTMHIFKFILFIGFTIFSFISGQSQDPLHFKDRNLPCVNRTFFTYVHIVKDSLGHPIVSEEEVKSILNMANKAFEPICISFDFCAVNYIDDYSFLHINDGEEVGLIKSRFHKNRRINLYIVNSVFSETINSFSYHKSITTQDSAIVIIPQSGIGLMHELGHTFGLYHTFETKFGVELVNGSNCEVAGDLLCDTPADPGIRLQKGCEFDFKGKDPNNDFYRTEIGNYMTHYFCAHCFFTSGQYEIMAKTFLESEFKMW